MVRKRDSIYFQLFQLLVLAALVSGLFFGFAFGVAGIGAAVLGDLADSRGIDFIYNLSGFMPLIGLAAWFLPNLKK